MVHTNAISIAHVHYKILHSFAISHSNIIYERLFSYILRTITYYRVISASLDYYLK